MVVSGYTHFPAHDTFSFFYVAVRTLRIPSTHPLLTDSKVGFISQLL